MAIARAFTDRKLAKRLTTVPDIRVCGCGTRIHTSTCLQYLGLLRYGLLVHNLALFVRLLET